MSKIVNIVIDQGSVFSKDIPITHANGSVFDLTGYTGTSQFRKHPGANTATNLDVTLGGNTGVVTLGLAANAALSLEPGQYVYDVVVTSANVSTRVAEGMVYLTPGVTRSQ